MGAGPVLTLRKATLPVHPPTPKVAAGGMPGQPRQKRPLQVSRIVGPQADHGGHHQRSSSLFYKTMAGAHVGDVFMSLIHSAELNKVNPFDCLVAHQRYHALVEENPEAWLPWNYAATLAGLGLEG